VNGWAARHGAEQGDRLSWVLDLTAVEGRKHFAVGINPQNEMNMGIGYPSAEHRRHKDDAVADHSHVRPHAGPVVDRVARVTHVIRPTCKFIAVGPGVDHGPLCPTSGVDVPSQEDICCPGLHPCHVNRAAEALDVLRLASDLPVFVSGQPLLIGGGFRIAMRRAP
jgi:hypothetical protein